ncbi:MAG: hypothetical protein FWF46_02825 [Oscillospiraceae bacterium]|nr:hypothetical protein [Oscillospiraceae bacterium]
MKFSQNGDRNRDVKADEERQQTLVEAVQSGVQSHVEKVGKQSSLEHEEDEDEINKSRRKELKRKKQEVADEKKKQREENDESKKRERLAKQRQQKADQKQASKDVQEIREQKQEENQRKKFGNKSVETAGKYGGIDTPINNKTKQKRWKPISKSHRSKDLGLANNSGKGLNDEKTGKGVEATSAKINGKPEDSNNQGTGQAGNNAQDIVAAILGGVGVGSVGGLDVQVQNGGKKPVANIVTESVGSNAQSAGTNGPVGGEDTDSSQNNSNKTPEAGSGVNTENNGQNIKSPETDEDPYSGIFGNNSNENAPTDTPTDIPTDTPTGTTGPSARTLRNPGDIPIVPPVALGGYFGRRLNNLRIRNNTGITSGRSVSNYGNSSETMDDAGESTSPASSGASGGFMDQARQIGDKGTKAGNAVMRTIQASKFAMWLAGTPVGWVIGIIAAAIIIILAFIGAGSFLLNMPSMVKDRLLASTNEFFRSLKGIVTGEQTKITEQQIKVLGTYLQNMGYDLKYYGFAESLTKDANGNITSIQSKYLSAYMAAEERSYLFGNEGVSVSNIFENCFRVVTGQQIKWGVGMIVLDQDTLTKTITTKVLKTTNANPDGLFSSVIQDLNTAIEWTPIGFVANNLGSTAQNILERAQINRDTQELILGSLNVKVKIWNTGYDVYRFSLKQWIEDYGSPMELFLTLHLATRAPEFVYNMATTYDTRVYVNTKTIDDVQVSLVKVDKDANNNVILDSNGKPKMIPLTDADLKGITGSGPNEIQNFNNTSINVFTPYITTVEKNWYYDKVIFQGTAPNGQAIDVYKMEPIDPNSPGAVRYYAYTQTLNNDATQVGQQTQEVPASSSSGGLFGGAIGNLLSNVFSNFGGIAGTIGGKISSVIQDAGFGSLGGLTGSITNGFGAISNGMFQNLDSSLLSNISNSWTQGFGNLNISQITSSLNLNNMSSLFNTNNLLQGLNSLDTSKFNLTGITNISNLSSLTSQLNMSNLNSVLNTTNIGNVINYNGMNIDSIVNNMYQNFSPSMLKNLDSQVSSMMSQMFDLSNPADATTYAKSLTDSLSKQIVDNTAASFLNQISAQVQQTIAGQLNSQLVPGLENEFSRQISGLSMAQLNSLASINNMDFNSVENISNKVSSLQSALNATDNTVQNLSDVCNKITKSMTGQDLAMINNAIKTQNIDDVVNNASSNWYGLDKDTLLDFVNRMNSIDPYQSGLTSTIDEMKKDTDSLDVQDLKGLCDKLSAYIKSSGDAFNGMNGLLDSDKNDLSNNLNKLYSSLNLVTNCVNGLDINALTNIKSKVSGINSQLLTGLGAQLSGMANSTINNLINQIKSMPNQIISNLQNQLTTQISQGLKQAISQQLSDKLSTDLFNSLNTGNRLTQIMAPSGGNVQQGDPTEIDQPTENSTTEYATGLYVKEVRKEDYIQKAEPIRIPYNTQHWIDLFIKDKYIIVGNDNIDISRLADPTYMPNDRQSVWQATNGHLDTIIYGMLDSVGDVDSQYLLRDFKELFTDNGWALQNAYNKQNNATNTSTTTTTQSTSQTLAASEAFSWIFKTTATKQTINTNTGVTQTVLKATYEPYTWVANTMGILTPITEDKVYGFNKGLDVISPVSGVVISKTDQTKNELGQITPSSITIEVRNSGDKDADGMRVVIMGIDIGSNIVPGMQVYKESLTSTGSATVIGTTGTSEIKIMVLSKSDHTMVSNISDFLKPPQEMRFDANGNQVDSQGNPIK